MKLWLVRRDRWDYDTYDAFVIRAENKRAALIIAAEKEPEWHREDYGPNDRIVAPPIVTCTEIRSEGESGIILGSFNAG